MLQFKRTNHSISDKITRSIIIVALLSCVIIGLSGIISVTIVNSFSSRMYNQEMKPLANLYKSEQDLLTLRMNFRNMVIDRKNASAYLADNEKAYRDLVNQLAVVGKHLSTADDRATYKKLQADLVTYKAQGYDVAMNYIRNGQFDAESKELYSNGNTVSANFDADINRVFSSSDQSAQWLNQTSVIVLFVALGFILAMIVVLVLVAVRTGRRIAANIAGPIGRIVQAADSISAGDLDVSLDLVSDDETGLLAESFKKVIAAFQRLETDVETLIAAASAGDLDKRADVERHQGSYREIVKGMNRMLDTVKEPLDAASHFIVKLADGEKQTDLENIYQGYYAALIDNLNQVRQSISILANQSQLLAEAGSSGDLDVRGDSSQLHGIYAEIIEGVNATFDSIKAPLDVAATFISGLAVGSETTPLENNFKGYYAKLIENLNSVSNSIQTLLNETGRLSDAGQNGNLDVRGSLDGIHGGYAAIIDGFNKTLDAIVLPLKESSRVLTKISNNDYTDEMTGRYSGAFKEFAESINTMRMRLLSVQDAIRRISLGDLGRLEEFKKIGKRSENDKIMPAVTNAYQTIQNLIDESKHLAAAAFEGKLEIRGKADQFEGEYVHIIEGMNLTMEAVSAPIKESSEILQRLADGDLTAAMAGEYQGAYNLIKENLNAAIRSFNTLLSEISRAADQVAAGATQVSDGSQSLSQGTTEQAAALEELTSSISEIALQTKQNAGSATQANTLVLATQTETANGTESMRRMLEAIREISESSANISKINKTIEDLAFQTNILALNAAVESARAGQYGKGFAVVAEEVRNLAVKSSEAAKETSAMIENAIGRIDSGSKIAEETSADLSKISGFIEQVTVYIGNIATASNEQATNITQIDLGLTQVSAVVQTNSATAEESAASSEELSGQADILKQMIGKFVL
jgi:Methyl-accepting chemotaxis protein